MPQPVFFKRSIFFCLVLFVFTFLLNKSLGNTFIRIAFGLFFIYLIKSDTIYFNWRYYKKYLLPLLLFYLLTFISLFFSKNFVISIGIYEYLLKLAIPMFMLLILQYSQNKIKFLLAIFLFACVLGDGHVIYQHFILGIDKGVGFDYGYLDFTGILTIQIPIFIGLFSKAKNKSFKLFYGLLMIFSFTALYANGGRVGTIAVCLDIIIFSFYFPQKWLNRFILFITFAACLVSLYAFNARVTASVNNLFNMQNISTRGHYYYMRDGYCLFLNNKAIGVGLGNFSKEITKQHLISSQSQENLAKDMHEVINEQNSIPHSHNTLIMFLAQFGIGGCVLFLLLYGSTLFFSFKEWYKKKDITDFIMFIIILNCIIRGLTDYTLWNIAPAMALYIIYGLYISYKANFAVFETVNIKRVLLCLYGFIIFVIVLTNLLRHFSK